ncbi:MAG: class I SAM-dependent methyltransferase [Desulfitobacteriaceae bacterium]|nr:class I SAM-dependent methyltransferase [Desulfitobacteriaceae bacterium]MDD4346182.1 class I SAM-dependent methyltransferase [Desulfitobacteriaceae bacterium]MDD4401179.1 class I SAM-dependent methyltransferase [Desulfitobacteriaceae bacterium]
MRSYQQVIKDRYDGREKSLDIYNNIYSIINPIGFNGHTNIENAIYKIFRFLIEKNIDIRSIEILDVGCGSGWITRIFAEFTGNPRNIMGIDLSEYRIQTAKEFNPNIEYIKGDIVEGYQFPRKFDLITAFDIFMHLNTIEMIEAALVNIYKNLNPNGFFVWFDAYAKDHFKCAEEAELNGFNSKQMDMFAEKAGFTKVYEFSLYKYFLGRHSLYLYNKLPIILVKLIEKVIPGSPGNMLKLFKIN